MPIDINTDDGVTQGTLSIDYDSNTADLLSLTIVGRSLTPPQDGPELGTYCTGDAIKQGFKTYVDNELVGADNNINNIQILLTNTQFDEDQTITALGQEEKNATSAASTSKVIDAIKAAIQEEIKLHTQSFDLAVANHKIMSDIRARFTPLNIIDTHTQCFKITYTNPYEPTNKVERFGIKSELCSGIAGRPDILQPTEYVLYNLAKDYLANPNNHVVLLDIFARKNGTITEDTNHQGHPETHTIVLWKQSNLEIFVIDPNQKAFSDFIVRTLKVLGEKINNERPRGLGLGDTFYKNNYLLENGQPKVGRKIGYMRDCIDIAIKAGFELNRLIAANAADDDTVLKSLYTQLSNDLSDEWAYFKALKNTRDAHSTDKRKAEKALEITAFIKKELKLK